MFLLHGGNDLTGKISGVPSDVVPDDVRGVRVRCGREVSHRRVDQRGRTEDHDEVLGGSGIPQLKTAYRQNYGLVSFRIVWVKFVAATLSVGGVLI